jgi:hypothetical protein
VRAVEQARREAVLLVRAGVAEDARLQPCERIEEDERRQLAAREDVVADADLDVDVGVDEPLVDALVARAEQDRAGAARELGDSGLPQRNAGRAEADERRRRRLGACRADRSERALERLDEEHHPGPAAVRPVVDARVRRVAEGAQRPEVDVDPAGLERPLRHAVDEVRREELGKQRDDVDAHRRSRPFSVVELPVDRDPAPGEVDAVDVAGDERNQQLAGVGRRRLDAQDALHAVVEEARDAAEEDAVAIGDGHADEVGPVELVGVRRRKVGASDETRAPRSASAAVRSVTDGDDAT